MEVTEILKDQRFLNLPNPERSKVLQRVDPKFAALPEQEQSKVLHRVSSKAAMDFFQSNGWEKHHAAGIVGNLDVESDGMNAYVREKGNSKKGWGLAQWTSPNRMSGLLEYAKSKGEKVPSFYTQLEYVNKELGSSEKKAGDLLRRTKTPEAAAKMFSSAYERPGVTATQRRVAAALDHYNDVVRPSRGTPRGREVLADAKSDAAVISRQPSTGQKIARAVAPYTKYILPFAGSVIGGTVAAPANIIAPGVAEAGGIALGGAAGIQGQRWIEQLANAGKPQQPTSGEMFAGLLGAKENTRKAVGPWIDAAGDVATTLGTGALIPAAIRAPRTALQAFGSRNAKQAMKTIATEGAAAKNALSKETGVRLTPAQIGQKKGPTYVESQLRHSAWGADEAQAFDQEQIKALEEYSTKIQREIFGGTSDPVSAGTIAKSGAQDRFAAFKKRGGQLYRDIPVNPKTPVPTEPLAEVAEKHIDELGQLQSGTIKRILGLTGKSQIPSRTESTGLVDSLGRQITKEIPSKPSYTWEQLREDISELGKMASREKDGNRRRILYDLMRGGNDSIAKFAEAEKNPEIKQKLLQANKYWREGERVFGPTRPGTDLPGMSTWGRKEIRQLMAQETPEKIGATFFKAKPNRTQIMALKESAGKEGFQEIKQSWLEDMLSRGEDQSFSHNRFITAYNNYKASGNLDVMLTKQEREGLDKLYQISKAVQWSQKVGGNPSGSGIMSINNISKWIGHPLRSIAQAMGTREFSKRYFNDPEFQKQFVDGLKLPIDSIKGRSIAGSLAASISGPLTLEQRQDNR
jgi:hypothetical protein